MEPGDGDRLFLDLIKDETDEFKSVESDDDNNDQVEQAGQVIYETIPAFFDHLEDGIQQVEPPADRGYNILYYTA